MNRVIKFRVYSEFAEKMLSGVNQYGGDEPDCRSSNSRVGAFTRLWEAIARIEQDDSCHLMQFTGLQDKNGTDIYEKDIVNISGCGLCRVEIQPYCGVVYIELNENMCGTDAHDVMMEKDDIFVIGNIYENKDLLR